MSATPTGTRRSLLRRAALVAACGLVAGAPPASAAEGTFRAPQVEGPAGGEVVVPVRAVVGAQTSAMQGALSYDPTVLEAIEVTSGPDLPEGARADSNADRPGWLRLGFVCSPSKACFQGEGVVLRVRFRVKGAVGARSALEWSSVRAWEPNDAEILVRTEPGAVVVGAPSSGVPLGVWIGGGLFLLLLVVAATRRRRPARRDGAPAARAGSARPPPSDAGRPPPRATAPAGTRFCTACGASVVVGQRFCGGCGGRLA